MCIINTASQIGVLVVGGADGYWVGGTVTSASTSWGLDLSRTSQPPGPTLLPKRFVILITYPCRLLGSYEVRHIVVAIEFPRRLVSSLPVLLWIGRRFFSTVGIGPSSYRKPSALLLGERLRHVQRRDLKSSCYSRGSCQRWVYWVMNPGAATRHQCMMVEVTTCWSWPLSWAGWMRHFLLLQMHVQQGRSTSLAASVQGMTVNCDLT